MVSLSHGLIPSLWQFLESRECSVQWDSKDSPSSKQLSRMGQTAFQIFYIILYSTQNSILLTINLFLLVNFIRIEEQSLSHWTKSVLIHKTIPVLSVGLKPSDIQKNITPILLSFGVPISQLPGKMECLLVLTSCLCLCVQFKRENKCITTFRSLVIFNLILRCTFEIQKFSKTLL